MTQEDKDLLIKDLSGRLPYRHNLWLFVQEFDEDVPSNRRMLTKYIDDIETDWLLVCKPYLRPMLNMTKEEEQEYSLLLNDGGWGITEDLISDCIDWLNANHFDYRGLIERGLALSTEIYNPYKD